MQISKYALTQLYYFLRAQTLQTIGSVGAYRNISKSLDIIEKEISDYMEGLLKEEKKLNELIVPYQEEAQKAQGDQQKINEINIRIGKDKKILAQDKIIVDIRKKGEEKIDDPITNKEYKNSIKKTFEDHAPEWPAWRNNAVEQICDYLEI